MAVLIVPKDPADEFPVRRNWSSLMALDDDTITSSAWRVDPEPDAEDLTPLEIDGDRPAQFDTTSTTVFVKGGTAGVKYRLVNTIGTADGNTWEETTHKFDVRDR